MTDWGHQVPQPGCEGTGCRDGRWLGKAASHQVPGSGRKAGRRSSTLEKLRVRKERAAVWAILRAPLSRLLSCREHRALWRCRVAASVCVNACHKGLLGHPVPR